MTATVYNSAIARFGNSQGLRIPQDILKQANLYEDFSKVQGGKIPVTLEVTPDSITIRRKKTITIDDLLENYERPIDGWADEFDPKGREVW